MISAKALLQKLSKPAWFASSLLVLFVGIPAILNWHIQTSSMGNLFSAWATMQFNTALCFVLTGIALACMKLENKKIARAIGIAVFTLGLATLSEYVFNISIGIDDFFRKPHNSVYSSFLGRMAPNSALSFLLIGLSLVLSNLKAKGQTTRITFITGLISSLPIAFGAVTLVSYFSKVSSTYGWGNYALMSAPTATAFIFSGILLLTSAVKELKQYENKTFHFIPLFLTLFLFSLSITLWQFFLNQDANKLKRITEIQAQTAKTEIIQILEQHILSLKRLAMRLEFLKVQNKDLLALDSAAYIKHLTGLIRVGLVDKNYKVIWSYPKEISTQVRDFDQSSEPKRKAAFDFALTEKKPTLSQSISLKSGGTGFLIPIALFPKNKFSGFLYATVNAKEFFDKVLKFDDYQIEIREEGSLIYSNGIKEIEKDSEWEKNAFIDWGAADWNIELVPTVQNISKNQSFVHLVVLVASLSISLLMGFFLQLLLVARNQKIKLDEKENQFRLMVEGIKDYAVFLLDPNGNVMTWNEGAQYIKGYTAEEIVGQHFAKFYPPEAIEEKKPEEAIAQALATGRYEDEGWRICKDGTRFWASVVITKVTHADGTHLGFAEVTRDLSFHRQAELDRKELMVRLNIALSSAQMGIWSLNLADHQTWRSENHDKIFGHPNALRQWTHEVFLDHVISEDRPMVEKQFALSREKESSEVECRIQRANDKAIRWVSIQGKTFYGTDKKPTHMIGIVRDITERKHEEQERWASGELLRAVVDGANYSIISTNTDGIIQTFNRAAEQMLGYSAAELVGKASPKVLHDADEMQERAIKLSKELHTTLQPGFEVFVAKAKTSEAADESEWTYVRKDGSRFPASISVTVLRNSNKEITGFLGIGSDITEKKNALEELHKTTKQLKMIFDSSPVGILALDRKLKITAWNKACETIFGWTAAESLGKFLPFVPADKVDESLAIIERIHQSKETVYFEGDRFRKDGRPIKTETAAVPFFDEKGEVEGLIAIMMDITEKNQLQKKLRETNNELTTAIETALKEQGRAIEASRVKSEFLANMSHEIRTPINGVIGLTGILLDTKLNTEQIDYAENIKRSAESLLTIVNDILDFSKVEAGKLDLENIEFDLAQMLEDTVKTLSFSIPPKKLQIRTTGTMKWEHHFIGDPGRIRQVLTNLLGNAIKFTPKGTIEFKVSETSLGNSERNLRFEIQDEGIGISKSALNKLFQPFSQADTTTTRQFGGTGLGLSICKRLVELMNGQIGVFSEESKGSTFWFEVPLLKGSKISAAVKAQNRTQPKLTKRAGTFRILIADDNPINQKVTLKNLEALGLRADAVANGKEALNALRNIPYDLVLMDCQMPELDGYETTRIIRQSTDETFVNIPIIAMTANAVSGDKERCLAAGMNDYLRKPVKVHELAAIFEQWLPSKEMKAIKPVAPVQAKKDLTMDWSVLEDLSKLDSASDPTIIRELSEMFISTVPERIQTLRKFFEAKDYDNVKREAHSLKSSGGNLGAIRFARLCEELEDLQTWAPTDQASDLIEKISAEFEEVQKTLVQHLKKVA